MNTLLWNRKLRLYGYPVDTFVYTSNIDVRIAAKQKRHIIRSIKRRNEFGLPILSYILQDLSLYSHSSYLAYINSDILLNPDIFPLLRYISSCQELKEIKTPVGIMLIWLLGIDSIKGLRVFNGSINQ